MPIVFRRHNHSDQPRLHMRLFMAMITRVCLHWDALSGRCSMCFHTARINPMQREGRETQGRLTFSG